MLCHVLKPIIIWIIKWYCAFFWFSIPEPFQKCVPKCCSLVVNSHWKWCFPTPIGLMFLTSARSLSLVAGGNPWGSADHPAGREGAFWALLKYLCVLISVASVCAQVCLPWGSTPTQWVCPSPILVLVLLFGVVLLSPMSLAGLYPG